jgi:hypothetical protein
MATNATQTTDAPNQNNADDVETVDGIGPTFAERLREGGYTSRSDVADATVEELADAADTYESRVTPWIDAARTPTPRTIAADLTPAMTPVTPSPRSLDDDLTPAVERTHNPITAARPPAIMSAPDTPALPAASDDDAAPSHDYRTFSLTNIKNYVAAAVAAEHDDDTDTLLENNVTSMASEARNGAESLNLLGADHNPSRLGSAVVDAYVSEFGSLDAAIEHFAEMKGTRGRYVEDVPELTGVLRRVVQQYEPFRIIADVLESAGEPLTIRELTERMFDERPEFVKSVMIRGDEATHERVFGGEGISDLESPHAYRSTTAHKIKSIAYHAGAITTTGDVPSRLAPTEQMWAVDTVTADDLRDDGDD